MTRQVDLCGHATLASAQALRDWGLVPGTAVRFLTKSGDLVASFVGACARSAACRAVYCRRSCPPPVHVAAFLLSVRRKSEAARTVLGWFPPHPLPARLFRLFGISLPLRALLRPPPDSGICLDFPAVPPVAVGPEEDALVRAVVPPMLGVSPDHILACLRTTMDCFVRGHVGPLGPRSVHGWPRLCGGRLAQRFAAVQRCMGHHASCAAYMG